MVTVCLTVSLYRRGGELDKIAGGADAIYYINSETGRLEENSRGIVLGQQPINFQVESNMPHGLYFSHSCLMTPIYRRHPVHSLQLEEKE